MALFWVLRSISGIFFMIDSLTLVVCLAKRGYDDKTIRFTRWFYKVLNKLCGMWNRSLTAWIYGGQMGFVKRHLMFVPHENMS